MRIPHLLPAEVSGAWCVLFTHPQCFSAPFPAPFPALSEAYPTALLPLQPSLRVKVPPALSACQGPTSPLFVSRSHQPTHSTTGNPVPAICTCLRPRPLSTILLSPPLLSLCTLATQLHLHQGFSTHTSSALKVAKWTTAGRSLHHLTPLVGTSNISCMQTDTTRDGHNRA